MDKDGVVMDVSDARRFPRGPFHTMARYWYAADDKGGAAICRDLGRGGLSFTMGRYLRPGRFVMLEVEDPAGCEDSIELKGRVIWCRPASDPCMFVAGVQVFHDDPQSVEVLAGFADRGLGVPGAEDSAEIAAAIPLARSTPGVNMIKRLSSVARAAAMITLV